MIKPDSKSSESLSPSWVVRYSALFGSRRLSPEVIKEFECLLNSDFADRWQDRIVTALDSISEDQRKAGKGRHAPDYGEIKSAIIRTLYAGKPQQDRNDPRTCGLCENGWLTHWTELPEQGFSFEDTMRSLAPQLPCTCSIGQTVAFNSYRNKSCPSMDVRKFAVRQNQYFKSLSVSTVSSDEIGVDVTEDMPF